MTGLTKGIAVAVVHILIVTSLAGKLLYDRHYRPRVWVKTGSIDPDLPIRGRYLTLRLPVQAPWFTAAADGYERDAVVLNAENGSLVAYKTESDTGVSISFLSRRANSDVIYLDQAVAFFLPEHAEFPRVRPGEELWAEVTVPRKGPPRPIQLALKRGTEWKPLSYR
ncbi:MAG TPA: hypothetical protein VI488_14105 [Candidatus Angelobacter sp.]